MTPEADASALAWQAVDDYWAAASIGDAEAMQAALSRLAELEPEVMRQMSARLAKDK